MQKNNLNAIYIYIYINIFKKNKLRYSDIAMECMDASIAHRLEDLPINNG